MELPPQQLSKIIRELRDLQQSPIDGVKIIINEENFTDVQADYEGPAGTPYEDGIFKMKLLLGPEFPSAPPKGYFLTKIFHPNVSASGEICVNVLKRDWQPTLGLRHVLTVIRCLLIEPNAESALNEEAGKLLLESFGDFAKKARLMTSIHAIKKPSVLTAAGGANALNAEAASGAGASGQASAGGGMGGGNGGPVKPKPAARTLDKKRSLKRL